MVSSTGDVIARRCRVRISSRNVTYLCCSTVCACVGNRLMSVMSSSPSAVCISVGLLSSPIVGLSVTCNELAVLFILPLPLENSCGLAIILRADVIVGVVESATMLSVVVVVVTVISLLRTNEVVAVSDLPSWILLSILVGGDVTEEDDPDGVGNIVRFIGDASPSVIIITLLVLMGSCIILTVGVAGIG